MYVYLYVYNNNDVFSLPEIIKIFVLIGNLKAVFIFEQ